MKKMYGGKVTLEVYTVVEGCEDLTQERNNAHEDCDFEFFARLRSLANNQGLYVTFVGADLHQVDDVENFEIEHVHKFKEEMKKQNESNNNPRYMRIQL